MNAKKQELLVSLKIKGIKIKEKNVGTSIVIHVIKNECSIDIRLIDEESFFTFETFDMEETFPEEEVIEILQLCEEVSNENGKILLIPKNEIKQNYNIKIGDFTKKMTYKKLTDNMVQILDARSEYGLAGDYYAREDEIQKINLLIKGHSALLKMFSQYDKNKPLFRVTNEDSGYIEIYYAGYEGNVKMELEGENLVTVFEEYGNKKKTHLKIKTLKEVKESVDKQLDKFYAALKIRSLFDEPKTCLMELMDGEFGLYGDELDELYSALRKHYMPFEIEEIADEYYKKENFDYSYIWEDEYILFPYGKKVVVMSTDGKKVHIVNKSKGGIEEIVKIKLDETKKEVIEGFKELKII